MNFGNQNKRCLIALVLGCMVFCSVNSSSAKQAAEIELTAEGKQIRQTYVEMLNKLSAEVVQSLPAEAFPMQSAFEQARAAVSALSKPGEDAGPKAHQEFQKQKAVVETRALQSARAVLADSDSVLSDASLDGKLMRIAILRHGTPEGLAEFAQQGQQEKALLDRLLADEPLMKQMLMAGGANGGEYGEAMQVYTAILDASERAREPGVLQNLALGTALHQPWLSGKERGSVNGIVFTDNENPDGQVSRYLHYEKAFLAGELDPAFESFNAWECRFITNDPYTNEELTWARQMLRNFRPDHITNRNHSWRYVGLVKSDLPYCSTTHDESLGMAQQQALALGGVCGRRAFFGRFITRAFGIPARRSTQTGHAAMNFWTPDGWVVRLGAWWSMNWCGPQGGLDFYLDSQAREFPEQYMRVVRAQWIGDALGEEDVNLRQYGRGGGFWNGLAFYHKRVVVDDANSEQATADAELASLTEEEARLLGESDKILGVAEITEIEIPEEDKSIVVAEDGTIIVPAVACTSPKNNNDKVTFLRSWDEGMQIHYQRLGERPEILRYSIEAPKAGKYEVSTLVTTVSTGMNAIFRVNRRELVDVKLPYSKGMWTQSEPQVINLREGRNSIMVTFRAPNRGVSIKQFELKPVQ